MNNKLLELFTLSGKKKYEFHYKIVDKKENTISVDNTNKIITAIIGDSESKDLPSIIDVIIKQLE
jgi:hypothetical protein